MADRVFNSVIATGSRANTMVSDMKSADFKELHPNEMTSTTAIGPVPAIDTQLIFGSECEYLRGYRDTHITLYDSRQIDTDLFETANGQAWKTYKQGHQLTINDHDKTEIYGTRDVHVTGEDVEHYDVHREITEPSKFETSWSKREATASALDLKGVLIEATASKAAVNGLVAEIEVLKTANRAIENKLNPLQTKITGLETQIGGFIGKVIATYDAEPSPSIIAPVD